jgi:hypothetical protein
VGPAQHLMLGSDPTLNQPKLLPRKGLRIAARPSAAPVAHHLPTDTCLTDLDPDRATVIAAWNQLPEAVRAGLLRWDRLPLAVRAGIEALVEAASRESSRSAPPTGCTGGGPPPQPRS